MIQHNEKENAKSFINIQYYHLRPRSNKESISHTHIYTHNQRLGGTGPELAQPRVGAMGPHDKVDLPRHLGVVDAFASLVHESTAPPGWPLVGVLHLDGVEHFVIAHYSATRRGRGGGDEWARIGEGEQVENQHETTASTV